ncbi:YdcF family protein [Erysipelotrichaceae bacterium RD49]|nr:YdcF family protein [Erysipelotrichaceae bacterium RD49]
MRKQNNHPKIHLLLWVFGSLFVVLLGLYEKLLPPTRRLKTGKVYPYGLVLGCACHDDGTPSHAMEGRCKLAIDEYRAGRYQTLIASGSAVKNQYVEAEEMEKYIHTLDSEIPILKETHARNTWENLKYTKEMIGDQPIVVITGQMHARRASAITKNFFSDYAIASYPDFSLKRLLTEIYSRFKYCWIELSKCFSH